MNRVSVRQQGPGGGLDLWVDQTRGRRCSPPDTAAKLATGYSRSVA